MTENQIFDLIESNKCTMVQLKDFADNRLQELQCTSPTQLVKELGEVLPNFKGYRKIKVNAKKGTAETPWSKGFTWQLEFGGDAATTAAVGTPAVSGIGVAEYIAMFTKGMEETNKLHREVLELKMKAAENDPAKWIPVWNAVAPSLGLNAGGIQGPPQQAAETKKELHFEDDNKKLTDQQISDGIGEKLLSISKKVSGGKMLSMVTALDSYSNLNDANLQKITALLRAINSNPGLLDTAMKFI